MIVATNLATIIDVFAQGRLDVERSESYNIGKETLLVEKPVYARIKKLSDGNYFLMWQKNRIASTVYYSFSSDLKTWSPGKVLFSPSQIYTVIGEDTRAYSSADALVLSNGDLIVAVAARAVKTYKVDSGYDWIVMRRSRDNGKTWEDEKKIYNGCIWEPFLYETPDCFTPVSVKTDTRAKNAPAGCIQTGRGGTVLTAEPLLDILPLIPDVFLHQLINLAGDQLIHGLIGLDVLNLRLAAFRFTVFPDRAAEDRIELCAQFIHCFPRRRSLGFQNCPELIRIVSCALFNRHCSCPIFN